MNNDKLGFYEKQLPTAAQRSCAGTIEEHFSKCQGRILEKIRLDTCPLTELKEVMDVCFAFINDHPELFYYDKQISVEKEGKVITIKFGLLYSIPQIKRFKASINRVAHRVFPNGYTNIDSWHREKMIFDYLQKTVDYCDDGKAERHNIVGALIEHKAVCEGISKAFCVLCHYAEIPCICMSDKSHMWNIVNIHGTPVNIDNTIDVKNGKKEVNYSFFNITDSEMNLFHKRSNNYSFHCNSDNYSYYRQNGSYFDTESQMKEYVKRCFKTGVNPIHIKLENGNIEHAINSANLYIPFGIRYIINKELKTAIIIYR